VKNNYTSFIIFNKIKLIKPRIIMSSHPKNLFPEARHTILPNTATKLCFEMAGLVVYRAAKEVFYTLTLSSLHRAWRSGPDRNVVWQEHYWVQLIGCMRLGRIMQNVLIGCLYQFMHVGYRCCLIACIKIEM
jgi:hypothetical protein